MFIAEPFINMQKVIFFLCGILWATNSLSLQAQTFTNFNTTNSPLPSDQINCIAIDADNQKWIGTQKGFAMINQQNELVIYNAPTDTLFRQITAIAIDSEGNKWLGTFQEQIYLIKLDRKGKYISHTAIPAFQNKNYRINAIAIDKTGNKWLATQAGGVWKIAPNGKWFCYDVSTTEEYLPSDKVNAIAIDENDVKWVGTSKGLCSTTDGSEFTVYEIFDEVTAVETDPNTGSVCVTVQNAKKKQKLYCNNQLFEVEKNMRNPYFRINDLAVSSEGTVWAVGTGIARYFRKQKEVLDLHTSDFTSNLATTVAITPDQQDLWIGTQDQGLFWLSLNEKREEKPKTTEILPAKQLRLIQNKLNPNVQMTAVQNNTTAPEVTFPELEIEPDLPETPTHTEPIRYEQPPVPAQEKETITEIVMDNKVVKKGEVVSLDNIQFRKASFELSNTQGVEKLLAFMRENQGVQIELAGHTDKNPDQSHPEYQRLSKLYFELARKRVETVASYLIKRGISPERIVTVSYGGERPLFNYTTERNRRVEMRILKFGK